MSTCSFIITAGTEFDKNHEKINTIQRDNAVRAATTELVECFGGVTINQGVGYYKHKDGKIVAERNIAIKVCVIDIDEFIAENIVNRIADRLKVDLNQECILIERILGAATLRF